jgi:hypothetical protein
LCCALGAVDANVTKERRTIEKLIIELLLQQKICIKQMIVSKEFVLFISLSKMRLFLTSIF